MDTLKYINLFYKVGDSVNLLEFTPRYEIGYIYINKLLFNLYPHHQVLLIVTSLYVYYAISSVLINKSKNPFYSIILFLSFRFFDISLSGVRQILAIATILLAHKQLMKDNSLRFFMLMILASSFHISSLVFLVSFFIKKNATKNIAKLTKYAISVGLIIIVSFDFIINIALRIFPKYTSYYYRFGSTGINTYTVILFIVHLIIYIFLTVTKNNGIRKGKSNSLQSNVLLLYQLSCVLLLLLAIKVDILVRLSNYFSIFLLLTLPQFISEIGNAKNRFLVTLLSLSLFIAFNFALLKYRPEWQSTYPFDFYWNDTEIWGEL